MKKFSSLMLMGLVFFASFVTPCNAVAQDDAQCSKVKTAVSLVQKGGFTLAALGLATVILVPNIFTYLRMKAQADVQEQVVVDGDNAQASIEAPKKADNYLMREYANSLKAGLGMLFGGVAVGTVSSLFKLFL